MRRSGRCSRMLRRPVTPRHLCIRTSSADLSALHIHTLEYTYTFPHASKTRACLLGKSDGSVQLRRTWSG